MSTTEAEVSIPKRERHPLGLYILFGTEMWERFGFYTAAAILTLYLQRGGFGWTEDQATNVWSYYLMFVYATPLVGGWLADRFIGYRRAVVLGGLIFIAGYATVAVGSIACFFIGIALICIGNGFFKPNISTMVGNLYPPGSPLKDSAYSIFYMGINVGALLAPVVSEGLLQLVAGSDALQAASEGKVLSPVQAAAVKSGYQAAFYSAAVGMTIGTVLFSVLYKKLAAVERRPASGSEAGVVEAAPTEVSALDRVPERNRVAALLVIYGIVIVFWMVFHQNGSTMTYWADKNSDWVSLIGRPLSGTFSNAINPFWIVVLSIPLVKFWGWLNKRGLEPSTPTKMVYGMLLTSLAFFILYVAAKSGGDQTYSTDAAGKLVAEQHRVSPLWLILAYAVISLGELMLSPMGLSLVSKVAPVRMRGLMMGGWFLATAIGNKLTAIGLLWTVWYHSSFWLLCSCSALVMAFVLLALLRPLKKAMPGV